MKYHLREPSYLVDCDLQQYDSYYFLSKHLIILGVKGCVLTLQALGQDVGPNHSHSFPFPISNVDVSPDQRFFVIETALGLDFFEYQTSYSHCVEDDEFGICLTYRWRAAGERFFAHFIEGPELWYAYVRSCGGRSFSYDFNLNTLRCVNENCRLDLQEICRRPEFTDKKYLAQLLYGKKSPSMRSEMTRLLERNETELRCWFLAEHVFVYGKEELYYWNRDKLAAKGVWRISGIEMLALSPQHDLLLITKNKSIFLYQFPSMRCCAEIVLDFDVKCAKFVADDEIYVFEMNGRVSRYLTPKIKVNLYLKYCWQNFGLFLHDTLGCLFIDYCKWNRFYLTEHVQFARIIRDNYFDLNEPGYKFAMLRAFEHMGNCLSQNKTFNVKFLLDVYCLATQGVAKMISKSKKITPAQMSVFFAGNDHFCMTTQGFEDLLESDYVKVVVKDSPIETKKTLAENCTQGVNIVKEPVSWLYATVMVDPDNANMFFLGIDLGDLLAGKDEAIICMELDTIIAKHFAVIKDKKTQFEKLVVLAKLLRTLNLLHFVGDGNGRMMLIAMLFCLHKLGLPPTLLFSPFDMLLMGAEEFALEMLKGFNRLKRVDQANYQKVFDEFSTEYRKKAKHSLLDSVDDEGFVGNKLQHLLSKLKDLPDPLV
jgi:hypothetical protein